MSRESTLWGLMAEFETEDEIVAASQKTYREGYRKIDAYTPYPIHELSSALRLRRHRLPWVVLAGGVLGGVGGFALQYYAAVIDYPLNIGGRPLNSWPAFVVVSFELTILFAALFTVLGMLGLNRLPQPYHPVFNVPRFQFASRDRFFLTIESSDARFERARTERFLRELGAKDVVEVPR